MAIWGEPASTTLPDGVRSHGVDAQERRPAWPPTVPDRTTRPSHPTKQKATIVYGSFVNDSACPGYEPTSDPTVFAIDCKGTGSIYTGGFTGHTLIQIVGTLDVYGNINGNYNEWFYGSYLGDGSQGGLHTRGTFSINGETAEFFAAARIVDGTCGFAGSTGTFTADGNSFTGGFTATWYRPSPLPTADATCNPVDPDSLPV
ncbi:MAG: hypothetical protein ABR548_11035 [Actinomycetota bacterium]|nr:hypothetical protein [Actinomycetota bacterium]